MQLQTELTLKEKLAVQKAAKWVGFMGHSIAGFDAELHCAIETDSLTNAINYAPVVFIQEKLPGRKRYYKVLR